MVGVALLVFAARSREIHLHAGDLPLIDQWKAEGQDILVPWVQGTLGWTDFFQPHHEHVPVWTRLLAWLQVAFTGRWDARAQMAINAVIQASFIAILVRQIGWALPKWRGALASAGAVATAVLPFAWENITWGFQSQFPLALLCLVLHVSGVLGHVPGTRPWWGAHAMGLAGLFTLGGMWSAPLAVLLSLAWTGGVGRANVLAGGALIAAGIAMTLLTLGEPTGVYARTLPVFLHAWVVQLGWPTTTVLVNLPLVMLALQTRARKDAPAFDRFLLALGVWVAFQAAAVAYARGGSYIGFVSRYGDLMTVGAIANLTALLRLIPSHGWGRVVGWVGAAAWIFIFGLGLHTVSTTAHTAYFHERSAKRNVMRQNAVHRYLADGELRHLADAAVREILYPDPIEVARQLSLPEVRGWLPSVSGPAWLGKLARESQEHWASLAILGVVLTGGGAWLARHQMRGLPTLDWRSDPWRAPLLAGVAAVSFAALFFWPPALVFGEVRRKERLLNASGTIAPVEYEFVGKTELDPGRIVGAALIVPYPIRNLFRGAVDQAKVRGAPFVLVTPWLTVPFAGFPLTRGIALEVVVENAAGEPVHTYRCAEGVPPGLDVGFWEINVSAHQNLTARIVMTDANSDPDGWIAATTPQYSWKPGQGVTRTQAWRREQGGPVHRELGAICLLSSFAATCAFISGRRSRNLS